MACEGCTCGDDCRWRAAHARRCEEIGKLHGRLRAAIVALKLLEAGVDDPQTFAGEAIAEVNRGRV